MRALLLASIRFLLAAQAPRPAMARAEARRRFVAGFIRFQETIR